jgi:hypothetical protein
VDPDGGEQNRLAEVDPDTGAVEWLAGEDGVRCEVGTPYGAHRAALQRRQRPPDLASNAP